MTQADQRVEGLLRECAPQVLGALLRRYRSFDLCEEATQEALFAAASTWPDQGVPANPWKWLVKVGSRRIIDILRADTARRAREERVAHGSPAAELLGPGEQDGPRADDELVLILLCCDPSLTVSSQVALTLRAVGGLTTAEIAAAFMVPEATMAQRIARAKQTLRDAGGRFDMPAPPELGTRLAAVMHVLYLVFTEGHTTTAGTNAIRVDLTDEAIRLARQLHRLQPDDTEATGLLALMLLIDARRPARTTANGELVPLDRQHRDLWNASLVAEGTKLITTALRDSTALGAFQLQAAINAVHNAATSTDTTDWPEIVALYRLLEVVAPNPIVTLNKAVAISMVEGPDRALAMLDAIPLDNRMERHHRTLAVRGHLLEMAGRNNEARDAFRAAARLALNVPERLHLERRAATAGNAEQGQPHRSTLSDAEGTAL